METINITVNKTVRTVAVTVTQGAKGNSAYQEALIDGFEGTKAQWLASLKGNTYNNYYISDPDGEYAARVNRLTFADLTEEEKLELRGAPLLWQDLTPEMKAEIAGEDGAPFTFDDFTPEQLEAIITAVAALIQA